MKQFLLIAAPLVGSTLLGLVLAPWFLHLLVREFPAGTQLIYVRMTDVFVAYLKIAFVAGFGLALPLVLHQLRRLTASLPIPSHRRFLAMAVPLAGFTYYAGVALALVVVLPLIATRLLSPVDAPGTIDIGGYVRLASVILFVAGSIFATPAILIALARQRG